MDELKELKAVVRKFIKDLHAIGFDIDHIRVKDLDVYTDDES